MYVTEMTPQNFRKVLGNFATGVCVLGIHREDGVPIGMTVNSFTSVSLDPPLILICLGNDAPRSKCIIESACFSINILADDQMCISNHFAVPGEGCMPEQGWGIGHHGLPVIDGALATLECDMETTHQSGDHVIVIGRVMKISMNAGGKPLLYFHSDYQDLGNPIK